MRKLILFMHVSLDGFVAAVDGEMDWINIDDEMFDLAGNQTDKADTALYGRVTYQIMENYWPTAADQPKATKHDKQHAHWYNQVEKVVLSKTIKDPKKPLLKIISNKLTQKIGKLKQRNGKNIIMFGSPSASHALMRKKLIDECWIFVNPVLIGKGIPLFKGIKEKHYLKLISSQTFPSGVVCLHYENKIDT